MTKIMAKACGFFQCLQTKKQYAHFSQKTPRQTVQEGNEYPMYENVEDMHSLTMSDFDFKSQIKPGDMRCLALISHNHMKPALRHFVHRNKNVLRKFRLTGTSTTMSMIKEILGDDPNIQYGPICQTDTLGGDAELCALMCMEDLGGIIFLQDPMDTHPHQADITCLNRLAHVHDILLASNPTSAYAMAAVFRFALMNGARDVISPFFTSKYSPGVLEYKQRQNEFLNDNGRQLHRGSIVSVSDRLSRDVRLNNIVENVYDTYSSDSDDATHESIYENIDEDLFLGLNLDKGSEDEQIYDEEYYEKSETEVIEEDFYSKFSATEMRCLALISHNHMKPAMKQFVLDNKNLLKKFRLTGTNTTMKMVQEIFGDDPNIVYGPTCQSGPLGGDAELCALMCMEDLGGIIFLQDPMDTHPHQADIDCLNRQSNVHDMYVANNVSSAKAMIKVLRHSLESGNGSLISSFFQTNISPSVEEYKKRQRSIRGQNFTKSEIFETYAKKLRRRSRLIRLFSRA